MITLAQFGFLCLWPFLLGLGIGMIAGMFISGTASPEVAKCVNTHH